MSSDARTAMNQGRIFSVPHFPRVRLAEQDFPVHIGGKKTAGRRQHSGADADHFLFLCFLKNLWKRAAPTLFWIRRRYCPRVENSPNFRNAQYPTGFTQFAECGTARPVLSHHGAGLANTVLGKPQMLKPIIIDVPEARPKSFAIPAPAWCMPWWKAASLFPNSTPSFN